MGERGRNKKQTTGFRFPSNISILFDQFYVLFVYLYKICVFVCVSASLLFFPHCFHIYICMFHHIGVSVCEFLCFVLVFQLFLSMFDWPVCLSALGAG